MDTSVTARDLGEDLYLMSNVQPAESGLPFVGYISEKQGQHEKRHDLRVKVGKPPNFTASVSVRPSLDVVAGKLSSREPNLVRQWGDRNRDVIIAHWEGRIASSRDVLNALKPLPRI